jgi:hypothetical protein
MGGLGASSLMADDRKPRPFALNRGHEVRSWKDGPTPSLPMDLAFYGGIGVVNVT